MKVRLRVLTLSEQSRANFGRNVQTVSTPFYSFENKAGNNRMEVAQKFDSTSIRQASFRFFFLGLSAKSQNSTSCSNGPNIHSTSWICRTKSWVLYFTFIVAQNALTIHIKYTWHDILDFLAWFGYSFMTSVKLRVFPWKFWIWHWIVQSLLFWILHPNWRVNLRFRLNYSIHTRDVRLTAKSNYSICY